MPRAALVLLLSVAAAAPPAARALTVRDVDGRSWTPTAPGPGEVHVLLFLTPDCPVSNRYAPEIDRIASDYRARGVRTFLIYADPTVNAARVKAHVKGFHAGVTLPAIIDTGLALTEAAGATITPEAAVYTPAGRVYRGRIDDLYVSLGQPRSAPTRRDLRLTLDAVLSGRPVPVAETQAVGCFIERKKDGQR